MGKTRKFTVDELLPKVEIDKSLLADLGGADSGLLNSQSIFGNDNPVWLEIGFGSGEHLLGLINNHKDINFLGAEPFVNGMSSFLKALYGLQPDDNEAVTELLNKEEFNNVKVLMDDAFFLVDALAENSIERIYILNPDPWPKKRHHKRRIIRKDNLDKFARILKQGGQIIMSTDVDELADWMFEQANEHKCFDCEEKLREKINRYKKPPDWIETRYEAKGIDAGRKQSYLVFYKI